jgi:tyrosine-protein phosphatase SIW14
MLISAAVNFSWRPDLSDLLWIAALLAAMGLGVATLVVRGWIDKGTRGLPNFARVTGTLFRGGQPTPAGLRALQAMGVTTIVNFRDELAETAAEKTQVESLGIRYVGIPWKGRRGPTNAQVTQFLDVLRTNGQAKIFVHCKRGSDRTGLMVAAYRVAVEHKPVAEALAEMRQFHYDWLWLPNLQRYIRSLPQLIEKDAQFTFYR